MTTRPLVIDTRRMLPLRRRIVRLSNMSLKRLLDALGAELESQTRRRLSDEKTDPEGRPWAEWSPDYAARRPKKGGILDLDGDLIDSIAFETTTDAVTIGSNLVYALVHQEGDEDRNIPQRAYLGVDDDNLDDLGDLVMAFIVKEAA